MRAAALRGVARIGEIEALIDVEIEIDRVERDDRRQQRRVRLHEVADRDQPAVDAARQRRPDLGEFEVEAGSRAAPPARPDAAAWAARIFAPAVVERGDGEVAGLGELLGALELRLGEFEQARRDVDLRLRRVVGRLVGPLVDGEQQIALLDDRAVLEMDLVEIAADARADGDLVDRLEAPDELVVLDDFAHDRLGDGDDRQLLSCADAVPPNATPSRIAADSAPRAIQLTDRWHGA